MLKYFLVFSLFVPGAHAIDQKFAVPASQMDDARNPNQLECRASIGNTDLSFSLKRTAPSLSSYTFGSKAMSGSDTLTSMTGEATEDSEAPGILHFDVTTTEYLILGRTQPNIRLFVLFDTESSTAQLQREGEQVDPTKFSCKVM